MSASIDYAPQSHLQDEMLPQHRELPYEPEVLQPHERIFVDTTVSLYDPTDIEEFMGFRASVPVLIDAGGIQLMVVDMRSFEKDEDNYRQVKLNNGDNYSVDADYLIINPNEWSNDNGSLKGYKGLRKGGPLIIGRENKKAREKLKLDQHVSRRHLSINATDFGLEFEDLGSARGTTINTAKYVAEAGRTQLAEDRVKHSGNYRLPDVNAPYGYFNNRHVLGRKSPTINGGVYLGGTSREAIVVDSDQDPRIENVYQGMVRSLSLKNIAKKALGVGMSRRSIDMLSEVLKTTETTLKYNGPAVNELSKKYYGDKEVSLGEYIDAGVGVCRHDALLAAYLIEGLINKGLLKGKVNVERNSIVASDGYGGAHAWATFISKDGDQYVIDPAQHFMGTKKQAREQGRWDYYLPMI